MCNVRAEVNRGAKDRFVRIWPGPGQTGDTLSSLKEVHSSNSSLDPSSQHREFVVRTRTGA